MQETQLAELRTQSSHFPERAGFIVVNSQNTLNRANDFLKDIKAFLKHLDDFFDDNIARLHKAHKEAKAQKTHFEDPPKRALAIVREVIRKYLVEQEGLRREAEEKARQEKEKKFEEARELEKEGKKEKAEEIRKEETALATPLPPVVKANGTHLRTHWTWQVVDIDKVPKEYFVLDALKINSIVRAMKDKTNIPGIRAFQESTVATRIK
ncbi:MAG: hypothetical protein KAU24_03695 [Candidatus Aenigmarchaeota archaeon]|nr:hypothetical protein [Candidatus Aenigmarchaeota archaeon]